MGRRVCVLILLLAFGITKTSAQTGAQDARQVLQAVSAAMGTDKVKTIQYSGAGDMRVLGQNYSPYEDWPDLAVPRYTRTIDYTTRTSSEQYTRTQGNNPPRGGGGIPIVGEQQFNIFVSGDYAWDMQGNNPVPQPALADLRQLDIWLTPHGFVKAANEATDLKVTKLSIPPATCQQPGCQGDQYGKGNTFLSFTMGKYRINGQIDENNMVLRTQTWVANPVLGDMFLEHRYTMYKDYGGIKFPGEIHSHSGLARTREGGHNFSEVLPASVQPNVTVAAMTVPDAVRTARVPAVRVESERLANGVWHIRGGSHHSVLVEFKDHVVMVEAPQNEARSMAVLAEAQRLVPNKPIRYVVNTHHHFDHSGGVRTYVAQSSILIGHESNRDFYARQLLSDAPRTVEPDILSSIHPWFSQTRYLAIEGVNEKYVLSDGVRTMDLYNVQGLNHATGMLMVYLPAEKILINADLYSPPAAGATPPTAPTPTMTTLSRNIQRLGLDVERHVGIHGAVGTHADFMRIVQAPAPARD